MSFLPITRHDELDADATAASERQQEAQGAPITTMQATLLGHLPSFTAYMALYELRDALVPFIGERAVSLFAYAISDEADSLVFSVHFRKVLVDSGEHVDSPQVTETEQLLVDWGRLIARSPTEIPDELYARLEASFNPRLRLLLVAFAGQLVASTVFAAAGRIPLDEELYAYRKPGDERTS
jgi:hypothetical protein